MTKEECAKILDEEIKRAGFARLVPAALYDAAIAAMLRAHDAGATSFLGN